MVDERPETPRIWISDGHAQIEQPESVGSEWDGFVAVFFDYTSIHCDGEGLQELAMKCEAAQPT